MSQLYNSGNKNICIWHCTGDLSSRHTVMYNWGMPVQIIHKALHMQPAVPEITILCIFSAKLSQVVKGLIPNLWIVTCKFGNSPFASVSVHLSDYFNIKCSLSCNVISYFKGCGWYGMTPAWWEHQHLLALQACSVESLLYWLWIALLKYRV